MTIRMSSITLIAVCDFLSTAITSFLVDNFHLRLSITINGLVSTDIQASVFSIVRIVLPLILI